MNLVQNKENETKQKDTFQDIYKNTINSILLYSFETNEGKLYSFIY